MSIPSAFRDVPIGGWLGVKCERLLRGAGIETFGQLEDAAEAGKLEQIPRFKGWCVDRTRDELEDMAFALVRSIGRIRWPQHL